MKIAISGCGIAGPALAFWLSRAGHEPVLIEKAPRLQSGGYVIDFWGVGYDIVEKMGLLPRLKDIGYHVDEVRFVDSHGRRRAGFSTSVIRRMTRDRFTTLRRSDLSTTLYSAVKDDAEVIFGDSIASIDEHADCLQVTFDRASSRTFDLVVGADGLHSRTRRIAFGAEAQFEVRLGLHVAAFETKGYRPRDELVYLSHTRPGRQISRFSMRDDRTLFLFVFRDEQLDEPFPATDQGYKTTLRHIFGSDGWEATRILAEMDSARCIYFDRVSQIKMDRWAKGRVALIGDAAACVSLLAGEGTGLAIAEAYVLAGELVHAGGNHLSAFTTYQKRLMPLLRRKQESAKRFASAFAPRSTLGLGLRNLMITLLQIPPLAQLLIGRNLHDDIDLPDYIWR